MREMWMMAPVLFPVVSGGALWIWNPGKNKIHTAAAVLSLAEAVCSWLVILNCMGMELPLWSIGPGMELCLRLDGTGALFSGLASLIWVLVVFFAFEYMEHEKEDARFFGCLIMSLGALTGVAWAGNFVTLYLFFEMMTFFSVPLVFHSRKREALRAGMVYLAYSMLGASIALGGYFFFRQYACGTDFKAGGVLTEAAGMVQGRPQILLLAVFWMAAGFSCKAGLMPLHPWLPIAHAVAPAPASAVLSGLITKAGVVAVIRVVYNMAGPAFLRGTWVQYALLSMAVVTIFTGSMLAYKEKKLKRRLACSSFSQVSYVLLGVFLLSMEGLYGSLLQMVFHALAKNALFLCAGAVICKTGCTRVKELRGMGKRMPAVMVCPGIPVTGGDSPGRRFSGKMASGRGCHEGRCRRVCMAGACGAYGQRPSDGGVSVSCYCGGIFSGKGLAENGSIRRWKIVCICIYGGASGRVRHLPAGAGGPGKSCF